MLKIAARALIRLAVVTTLSSASTAALAWVYPEHRELSLLAVSQLSPDRRLIFDQLWREARAGDEKRFCALGADRGQGLAPSCIDWAALAAIAGDHSCSSQEMLETARTSEWILIVADVAAQLKADLARIPVTTPPEASAPVDSLSDVRRRFENESTRAERVNFLRTANIRLQRADSEYATRAGANNAHFLLARPSTSVSPQDYADLTLQAGSDINAMGVYAAHHLSALKKASRLAREQLTPAQRHALIRAAMADEAFALHFLQDIYSAGHIAGAWGNTSQRQGTHDFYNEHGLEVFTWKGGSSSVVLMGDNHMRPEDAKIVASAVRQSLDQLLDVASGRIELADPSGPTASAKPNPFDICRNNKIPSEDAAALHAQPGYRALLASVLYNTPVPGLGPGLGAIPRFRSEIGPFIGLDAKVDALGVDGGFATSQNSKGLVKGLDLSVRAGFGLDGVMGESGDGLIFASLGLRTDSASSNRFNDALRGSTNGNLSAAIPARGGIAMRFRMPFYVLPGDLLLMSPLYLINEKAYQDVAVTAANGGLLLWQSGWATPIGRFQLVLGRELGVTFYGNAGHDELIAPSTMPGGQGRIVRYKSTSYDLPILEYRPYRAFSTNQSSSVTFQLFAGAHVPHDASTVLPAGAATPALRTVRFVGIRMMFDWRYYY